MTLDRVVLGAFRRTSACISEFNFLCKSSYDNQPLPHFQYVVLLAKAISVLLALSGVGRQQKHFERRGVCPKGTTLFFTHEIILSNLFSMNLFQPMSIHKPSNMPLTLAIQIQAGGIFLRKLVIY